jgi:hypothetical protein
LSAPVVANMLDSYGDHATDVTADLSPATCHQPQQHPAPRQIKGPSTAQHSTAQHSTEQVVVVVVKGGRAGWGSRQVGSWQQQCVYLVISGHRTCHVLIYDRPTLAHSYIKAGSEISTSAPAF